VVWQEWQEGHAGEKNWLPTPPRPVHALASNKEPDESGGHPQNDLNAQIAHSTWPWSLGRLTAETKGGAPLALPPDLQVKA
jgi:hypothetical protein